jgi:hypothetical protein
VCEVCDSQEESTEELREDRQRGGDMFLRVIVRENLVEKGDGIQFW